MEEYDYSSAGFDPFLSRSIDNTPRANLDDNRNVPISQSVSYDRGAMSGAFPDVVRIGDIHLDGVRGRISIYDGDDEVTRIGSLDD